MQITDLDKHLKATNHAARNVVVGGDTYLAITLIAPAGTHKGKMCEVAVKRSTANPWVPESALHVKPHIVTMGARSSSASELGAEWQKLSRRFDRPPTPKSFLAHLCTVVGEL